MTDNEIVRALECLTYGGNYCLRCEHKIIKGDHRCGIDGCHIAKKALDLINRQKAEIEKLQTVIFKKEDTMQLLHKEHQQTVDELQRKNAEFQYENLQMIASIENLKSKATKEFAEMKTINDITYSLKDIEEIGCGVENNIIKEIDINIIAHFGNIPCLTIMCENIIPYGHYNDISRLGYLLKAIVEFFGADREDGVMLSDLKNIPCRIVFEGKGKTHWGEKAVGIGHYMKDKFILFDDFSELDDHPTKKGGEQE